MHPIERLRWIARADGEAGAVIAAEAAWTLAELGSSEPAAVLTASRRLVERHPYCGPLWWACAHLVAGGELYETAHQVTAQLGSDDVPDQIVSALRVDVASSDSIAGTLPSDVLRAALSRRSIGRVRLIGRYRNLRSEIRGFSLVAEDVTGYEIEDATEALDGAMVLLVEPHLASPAGLLLEPDAAAAVAVANDRDVPVWAMFATGRVLPPQLADAAADLAGAEFDLVEPEAFSQAIDVVGRREVGVALAHVTCPSAPELVPREARGR